MGLHIRGDDVWKTCKHQELDCYNHAVAEAAHREQYWNRIMGRSSDSVGLPGTAVDANIVRNL